MLSVISTHPYCEGHLLHRVPPSTSRALPTAERNNDPCNEFSITYWNITRTKSLPWDIRQSAWSPIETSHSAEARCGRPQQPCERLFEKFLALSSFIKPDGIRNLKISFTLKVHCPRSDITHFHFLISFPFFTYNSPRQTSQGQGARSEYVKEVSWSSCHPHGGEETPEMGFHK